MEIKIKESEQAVSKPPNAILPGLWQMICFQEAGKQKFIQGKVLKKNKPKSIHRNMIKICMEDGTEKYYDVVKDNIEWKDAHENVEDQPEVCCFHSLQEEKDIMHEIFVPVLTKAQVKNRPDAPKAMEDEIKKFESFDAFEKVNDEGQFVIKTRWVFAEHADESKGYTLRARLCMICFFYENRLSRSSRVKGLQLSNTLQQL